MNKCASPMMAEVIFSAMSKGQNYQFWNLRWESLRLNLSMKARKVMCERRGSSAIKSMSGPQVSAPPVTGCVTLNSYSP